MSLLAEVFDDGETLLSASAIAEQRELQRPFLAKVLTTLTQSGLITGSRGPGGGFALAKPPCEISLHDVFSLFERAAPDDACPFGGGICGRGEPCAMHDRFASMQDAVDRILHDTTFDEFRQLAQKQSKAPAPKRPNSKH